MYSRFIVNTTPVYAVSHPISREMYSRRTAMRTETKLFPTPFRGGCTASMPMCSTGIVLFPTPFRGRCTADYSPIGQYPKLFPTPFRGRCTAGLPDTCEIIRCFPPHFEGDVQQQYTDKKRTEAASHPISRGMYSYRKEMIP